MNFVITNARTAFFHSKEEYLEYMASWKARVQEKNLTAQDFFAHALILGKNLYRAFSPRKGPFSNGQQPYSTLANLAYWAVSSKAENTQTPQSRLNEFLRTQQALLRQQSRAIAEGTDIVLTVGEAQ